MRAADAPVETLDEFPGDRPSVQLPPRLLASTQSCRDDLDNVATIAMLAPAPETVLRFRLAQPC